MHDRRIDGVPYTFGNAGMLYQRAMTWWDRETQSIWSQPWGRAIRGRLKGTELFVLPSQMTTWSSWLEQHPNTLVMTNDLSRFRTSHVTFRPKTVLGLFLADATKAYYLDDVQNEGVINDTLGDVPVVVLAQNDAFHAFVRQVGNRALTFSMQSGRLVDSETGSVWDPRQGRAISGVLLNEVLQPVPNSSAYDWAWLDFYPESDLYGE